MTESASTHPPRHLSLAEPAPDDESVPTSCESCGRSFEGGRLYRENEFRIIPPHGGSDRGVTYPSFQGPSKYMRIVELLFSNPLTPWKTASDVMRAFLDFGCRHFGAAIANSAEGRVVPGILHQLDMMNRLVDEARQTNDFIESIDQLDREAQRLTDGDMRESAVGLVYHYRELAKGMPDRILRRKLVADINKRFAYLLKGNQGRRDHEPVRAGLATPEDEG